VIHTPHKHKRSGAHLVEFAFVAIILALFMFGILEYGRFVFFLQVTNNAAREGARYAVVHTGDGTTLTDIQNYIKGQLAGRDSELANYQVTIQDVDPNTGIAVTGAQWNDAPFGGAILVRIEGDYAPILPNFLRLPGLLHVRATAMMTSEAN